MRANWKIPYVSFYLLRQFLYQKNFLDSVAFIWKASGRIFFGLFNKEFRLKRGNSLLKLVVKPNMFNTNLGEYVISKNMGIAIHERNIKRKKKKKKKKGVLANPIGYRLEVSGNWKDTWLYNNLTYTEFLHTSLHLRKFIVEFFEQKKFWETGILLNNLRILRTNKGIKLNLNWYPGKSYDKKKWFTRSWRYRKYIKKFISFFRIWQTRIYWLRYKFSKMEKKYFNKILKFEKASIFYNLSNEKVKINKRKVISHFKFKYTRGGNKVLSNFFLNKGKKYNKEFNSIFKSLSSKQKRSFGILKGILQSKEKKILDISLKQKKIYKIHLSYLRQFFSEISFKRDKYIGLNNLLKNKSFNIWKLLLQLTMSKIKENIIGKMFLNSDSVYLLKKNLLKLKAYLSFKCIDIKAKFFIAQEKLFENFVFFNIFIKFIYKVYFKYKLKLNKSKLKIKKISNIYDVIALFKNKSWLKFLIKFIFKKGKQKIVNGKKYIKDDNFNFIISMFIKLFNFIKYRNKYNLLEFYNSKLQNLFNYILKYDSGILNFINKNRYTFNFTLNLLYIWKEKIKRFNLRKIWYSRKQKLLNAFALKKKKKLSSIWSSFLIWFPRFFTFKIYTNSWMEKQKKITSKNLYNIVKEASNSNYSVYHGYLCRFPKESFQDKYFRLAKIIHRRKAKKGYRRIHRRYKKRWKYDLKSKSDFTFYKKLWKSKIKTKVLFSFYKYIRNSLVFNNSMYLNLAYNSFDLILDNPTAVLGPKFYKSFIHYITWRKNKIYKALNFKDVINHRFLGWRPRLFFDRAELINYWNLFAKTSRKQLYQLPYEQDLTKHYNVVYFLSNMLERFRFNKFNIKAHYLRRFKKMSFFRDEKPGFDYFLITFLKTILRLNEKKLLRNDLREHFLYDFFLFGYKIRRWRMRDEIYARRRYIKRRTANIKYIKRRIKLNPGMWGSPFYRKMMRKRYLKNRSFTVRIEKSWPYFWFTSKPKLYSPEFYKIFYTYFYGVYSFKHFHKKVSSIWRFKRIKGVKFRYLNSKPFLNTESNWYLWIYFLNWILKSKKKKYKYFYKRVLPRVWYILNFKIRFYSLYFYMRYGKVTSWMFRLFWAKYILNKNKNLKTWVVKYITNNGVESYMRQRLGFYLSKKNKRWLETKSSFLKNNLYGITKLKCFMRDFRSIYYKTKYIKTKLKKLKIWEKLKKGVKFWLLASKKARYFLNFNLKFRNILRRKRLKSKSMRKVFYKMTHKSPFAGYAGARILHKDYGKFIDYSKGRVGNRAFVFKDILKLKKRIIKSFKSIFLLGRNLIKYKISKRSLSKYHKAKYKRWKKRKKKNFRLYIKSKIFFFKKTKKREALRFLCDEIKIWRQVNVLEKRDYWKGRFDKYKFKFKYKYFEQSPFLTRKYIRGIKRRKVKYNSLLKLYFSKNIRRFTFLYKSGNINFKKNLKAKIKGRIFKKRIQKKRRDDFWVLRAIALRSGKLRNIVEHNSLQKIIKDKWWILKKIKYKLNRLINLNSNLPYLFIKIPFKKKLFLRLKKNLKNLNNVRNLFNKHNLNISKFKKIKLKSKRHILVFKKKEKLKKLAIFILKLKQLILNPKFFDKIWNILNIFDNILIKNKHWLKIYVRKKIKKIKKIRINLIYQKLIDRFRNIFEFMAKRKLELYVFSVNNENIEAELLTRYIFIKFKQKYSINFMLYPIRRELIKLVKMRVLDGFRIRLSGRFNRRQRSKVITLNYGLLPLTQKSKNIDFNERTLVLRFSILSIRVWLCRNDNWEITRKLQYISPVIKKKESKIKKVVRYSNNFINYGYYSNLNNTKGSLNPQTYNLLKKNIVKNVKSMNIFKENKPKIYNRFFNDNLKIYDEAKNFKYIKIRFLDAAVRSYLNMKSFKKLKEKNRWQIYRETIEKQGSFSKYKLYKKIDMNYKRLLNKL